jgi:hypothetical protein
MELGPRLQRPVGRPVSQPAPMADDHKQACEQIRLQLFRFVKKNPGCIIHRGIRTKYHPLAVEFLLNLHIEWPDLPLTAFCQATDVSVDTRRDWLAKTKTAPALKRAAEPAGPSPEATEEPMAESEAEHVRLQSAQMQSIINEYAQWKGPFIEFVAHIRKNVRIPFSPAIIADILQHAGLRDIERRPGRSPDEKALRKQFETWFPGAQWVADGSPIPVSIEGQQFTFNLELMVDTHTGAIVGLDARPQECAAAVLSAFEDAKETTGSTPIALLMDNRLSNHTPEIVSAIDPTFIINATKGRPQNDGHVEGAHGLFQQRIPTLDIPSTKPDQLAHSILLLVAMTCARVLNHKPRRDRNNKSRAQLYSDTPSPEVKAQAQAALKERAERMKKAEQTRNARMNPVVRALVAELFEQMKIDDPHGNILAAIARYNVDHVTGAMAIFRAKLPSISLNKGQEGRYLLGIVKNIAQRDQNNAIATNLWQLRLKARDLAMLALDRERRAADNQLSQNIYALINHHIDKATAQCPTIDRDFWIHAVAQLISLRPQHQHESLYVRATNRIHTAFQLPNKERQALARSLAQKLIPLA